MMSKFDVQMHLTIDLRILLNFLITTIQYKDEKHTWQTNVCIILTCEKLLVHFLDWNILELTIYLETCAQQGVGVMKWYKKFMQTFARSHNLERNSDSLTLQKEKFLNWDYGFGRGGVFHALHNSCHAFCVFEGKMHCCLLYFCWMEKLCLNFLPLIRETKDMVWIVGIMVCSCMKSIGVQTILDISILSQGST